MINDSVHVIVSVYVMDELIDLTLVKFNHSYKVGIYHIIGFYRKLNLKKLSYLSMTTGKENKARMELRH